MILRIFIIIFLFSHAVHCLEPISGMTLLVGGLISSYYFSKQISWKWEECCTQHFNANVFKASLQNQLFGQHLVSIIVTKAVEEHVMKNQPSKALVLSFHGWTGTGKNHVAKILASHLYRNSNKCVNWYIATKDFPHSDEIKKYREKLVYDVTENTKKCCQSLFIFDEVDKIVPGILDGLKPFIDSYEDIDGINFRKNIFIFLSNTGAAEITNLALNFWLDGKDREDITVKDIHSLINQDAFSEKGGLQESDIVRRNLIDAYVPFLPLEKLHVRKCIEAELENRGFKFSYETIENVLKQLYYFPTDLELYSTSGCKRVAQKVDLFGDNKYPDIWHEQFCDHCSILVGVPSTT